MTTNNSIKKTISFIKTELKDLYPMSEIDSFIYLIFEHLFNYSKTKLLISQETEIKDESFEKILTQSQKIFTIFNYIFSRFYLIRQKQMGLVVYSLFLFKFKKKN